MKYEDGSEDFTYTSQSGTVGRTIRYPDQLTVSRLMAYLERLDPESVIELVITEREQDPDDPINADPTKYYDLPMIHIIATKGKVSLCGDLTIANARRLV